MVPSDTEKLTGSWLVLGLMSGTSLDGVDLALARFSRNSSGQWAYEMLKASTINYNKVWRKNLASAHTLSGDSLTRLDREYGNLLADMIVSFLEDCPEKPGFICSHGHTVFHNPKEGYTLQIGSGAVMAARLGIPVVNDFRSADVALGGQGAPLVPVGDKWLFHDYETCLNLGGFANISFEHAGQRVAFDICPVNIVLNEVVSTRGIDFDEDGKIAASGSLIPELLKTLDNLPYYNTSFPKSLGREWIEKVFKPIYQNRGYPIENLLHTLTVHAAGQIARSLTGYRLKNVLITGGGAHNRFLVRKIGEGSGSELIIPQQDIVDYKEALIFAFLGLLSFLGEHNCLSSVTGASADSTGGVWHKAHK